MKGLGPLALTLACLACGPSGGAPAEHVPADTSAAIEAVSLSASGGGDDDPNAAGTAFPAGTPGVAARYRFAGARPGTRIDLRWTFEGDPIFQQREELDDPAGSSTWVLRMERGSPLHEGSYGLEILEDGRSVIQIPFTVGGGMTGGAPAPPLGPAPAPGGALGEPAAGDSTPARLGDEPGEHVRGLAYRNDSAGLSFGVPSYAWRFDPVSRREPGNAVVVGRFSPRGQGVAILRVRVTPAVERVEDWAAAQQRTAPPGRETLATETREIDSHRWVQVESRESGARILTAYAVAGGRGYAFEFRVVEAAYAALSDELETILGGVRFF